MVEARDDVTGDGNTSRSAQEGGISAPFEPLLCSPELRDAWRATFDATPLSCAWGLPTLLGPDALARWLRSSDVLIELSRAPSEQSFAGGVVLQAASATRAVDRMLGSTVETGSASLRGGPSEAECGLLAYAFARLLAASASGWMLRDVRLDFVPLVGARGPVVLWPFALETSFGPIDGALLLPPSTLGAMRQRVMVSALLRDTMETPETLRALEIGDLLVSDAWWMTDTAAGLTGDLLVSVRGTTVPLRARIERGQLTVYDRAEALQRDQLALIVAEHALTLIDVARLAGGEPVAFAIEGQRATLVHCGARLGAGELVLYGRQLALRISELAARSPP